MLEVQDQPHSAGGDFQIIQNLPPLNIRDPVYCFRINNNTLKDNQIGNEISDLDSLINHIITRLLREGDTSKFELNT